MLDSLLSKIGYQVTVFTPMVTAAPSREKRENVVIIRYPAFSPIVNYPLPQFWRPLFWQLYLGILRHPADVVISRTRFFFSSLLAIATARLKKIPTLHIEHGADFVYLSNPIMTLAARGYDLVFGRLVLNRADRIVAVSEAAAAFVHSLVNRKTIKVIYRGVDHHALARITANTQVAMRHPDAVIVMYRGRLIAGKGVDVLLHAFALLADLPLHLIINGDGPEIVSLQRLVANLQLTDRVTLFGSLPWQESIALLKAADIAVNPSFNEGLPTTIIEAALAGRAIVATNVGGTNEIVHDQTSALLVPPHNPTALAAAIRILAMNANYRATLGAAAANVTYSRFHWDSALAAYDLIFSEYLV